MFTDKLFTGQREMAGLGIYDYGARFYSPKLGRFLSADTIVQSYANPQSLNRYMYVLGNPVRYNDPTGHYVPCEADAGECHHDPAPAPSTPPPSPPDDDDVPDPNPMGLPAPAVCSSSICNPNFNSPIPTMEQTCSECGTELLTGIFALLEGLQGLAVGSALAYFVITGAPLWAAVIPAAIFVGVALVGLNWAIVGVEELYASSHPNEHIEIDYLPLVPNSWQGKGNNP